MSSSHFTSFIYLLTFALLLQTVVGVGELYHICTNEKFKDNEPYGPNLAKLLHSITNKTSRQGFVLAFIGQNQSQTNPLINGLALCRPDVNATDCKTCVQTARHEIRFICPNKKAAIIWYDYCLLKYSNNDFFGKVDIISKFYTVNKPASQPKIFNQKRMELLTQLAMVATATNGFYAAGELVLEGSKKLYGFTQCTLDLPRSECFKCLNDTINDEIPYCCQSREGASVFGGSCNVRYDVLPFLSAKL